MTDERAPWYSRRAVHAFVWSRAVQTTIVVVILINAVILGLQTSQAIDGTWALALGISNAVCLGIFVVELTLKIYADRGTFFRSGWNIFDFVIVAVSLIPGSNTYAVLRALRVLRVLRLVSVIPSLRRVVDGLGRSIPGIASVGALLAIIFYVSAVMATTLYGPSFPDLFGSLEKSLFTLFQMMTLDDWANVTRTVSEEFPYAPLFFIAFVGVSALTVLNLVVAVIVDAMQNVGPDPTHTVSGALDELRSEVAQLRADLAITRHDEDAPDPDPGRGRPAG